MPIDSEPLLVRTVRQLAERGFDEIVVVVGHMRAIVIETLHQSWGDRVRFVVNPMYATDTNIGSLLRGLEGRNAPTLVIEADVAFDDHAMDALAEVASGDESVWFTNGRFQSWQIGGVLRADAEGNITEIRYVPKFTAAFADAKKLLGVLFVGAREMQRFHEILRESAARSTGQYYMMPWVENLAVLPCLERDVGEFRTATFNTPEEYRRCVALFSNHAQEAHVA